MLGGAAMLLWAASGLVGQEAPGKVSADDVVTEAVEDDPFASDFQYRPLGGRAIGGSRGAEVRTTLRLRTETWELPSLDVIRAMDEGASPEQVEEWRGKLLNGGELVFAPVLVLDTGTGGSAESITEEIYPTEYEGGGLGTAPVSPKKKPSRAELLVEAMGKFTVPTAFETRNTGTTLEGRVQAVTAEDDTWDVLYALENVRLGGFAEYGLPELRARMPTFETFRAGGLIRLAEGKWQLASVQPAPLGMDKAAGKSWVTLIRIDRAR